MSIKMIYRPRFIRANPAESHYPRDMAQTAYAFFRRHKKPCPSVVVLTRIVEAAYFASMGQDEGERVLCRMVYLDPKNPDPHPPQRQRDIRWSWATLSQRVPLTVRNLVKISKATSLWSSSLAVYSDKQGPFIWGFVDQEAHYFDAQNLEGDMRFDRPGLFEVAIDAAGSVSLHHDAVLIVALRQGLMVNGDYNVFAKGPVHDALNECARSYVLDVERACNKGALSVDHEKALIGILREFWFASLRRILINIRRYKHGGALLIDRGPIWSGLKINYGLDYSRFYRMMVTHGALIYSHPSYWNTHEFRDGKEGITGCIRVISSLSRIDGLVLLDSTLSVKGFGVEIIVGGEPPHVFAAANVGASNSRLREVALDNFGTRHRSMMRYCYARPGSIGFVISQDGDVRAFLRVDDKLIMWDGVDLHGWLD